MTKRSPTRARAGALTDTTAMLIVAVCAFVLYANTLGASYTADDALFTLQNRFVQRGLGALPDLFSKGSLVGYDGTVVGPYRPLMLLGFQLEVALWGNNPHAHHAVNVVLYALLGVLLYRLLRRMFPSRPLLLPLSIALLYVFHPVHTEVVASIKSRDEILAWLFGILAFDALLGYARTAKNGTRIRSTLWFLLALLSKENSVMFVFVAPLLLWTFSRESPRRIAFAMSPWLVALLAYLGLRIGIQGVLMSGETLTLFNNSLVAARDMSERLATVVLILGRYLLLLVFPLRLSWDYSYDQIPIVGPSNVAALASVAVHVALVAYAVLRLPRRDPIAFGILFYVVTLSVVSNVFFLIASTLGERFLFAPSFGFCLVLGLLLWSLVGNRVASWPGRGRSIGASRAALYGVAGALLLAGARTIVRNRDWHDNYALFSSGVEVASRSARARSALGTECAQRGAAERDSAMRQRYWREAVAAYETMRSIHPADPESWFCVGSMKMVMGDSAGALEMFRGTLERQPAHVRALNNAGTIFLKAGQLDSAENYFKRSVAADSTFAAAVDNVGATYLARGDARTALVWFDRALRIEPSRTSTLENRRKAVALLANSAATAAPTPPAPGGVP